MKILHRDIESRSTLSLRNVGSHHYASDPATEVLCVGYAVDDGPVAIWAPGQPIPESFITAARDPDWIAVAHNDRFESSIEELLLHPRFGWPLIPIERHCCTMAAALASALPGSLEDAAEALGLPIHKDAEGHRLMLQMSKPRRPRKGEDPSAIYWHDDLERRLRLQEYCKRDVEVERLLFQRLPPLSMDEQKVWQHDAVINRRGFHIDLELAQAARKIVDAEQIALDAELAQITGGAVTSINQVAKLQALLQERGHKVTSLTKRSVSAVLAHGPEGDVKRILELRQEGAQAAARKLDSLIAGTDADHRMRGTLRYHGASTGRWSGSRFQPQNLKKAKTKDLDAAIDTIRSGDLERVRAIGAPLAIVGDVSRAMICAAPGHVLIGADFSAIESRVLAWLSGETWKLDTYRKYDETGDPALEPYCTTASRILQRTVTPADEVGRGIGKIADLAFGYGGSLGAWRKFDTSKTYTDDQIKSFCTKWRAQHAATVNFWRALESMLRRAIRTRQRATLKSLAAEMVGDTLFMTLASGRRLAYPGGRLEPGKYQGSVQIIFKDNAKGGWGEVRGWFGIFVENVVSAVSRDLLAAAMQRLEAGGYPVVLHVHDEAIAEVPEGFGSEKQFLELMTTLPDWAAGLPVVAKAWSGTRYTKSAPTAPPTAPTAMIAPTETNSESDSADAGNRELTTTLAVVENAAATAIPEKIKSDKASNNTNSGGGDAQHRCHLQMRNKLAVTGTSIAPINEADHGVVPLADLIGQPLNHDRKILCPFHDDRTPSLHIYDDHFKCFVCGARGDHIDWLMMIEEKSRAEAEHILRTWDGPMVRPRSADKDNESALAFALQIWERAKPIGSTSAIRYLADVRGIDTDTLPTDNAALRFHDNCPFGPGVRVPCLVALYRDVISDAPAGIHRIALTPERRKMLGPWPTPRAIKLWPATDQLFFGEGIETVLAAATRVQYRGTLMRPAWAAGSAGNISKFPVIAGVKELILLVDRDPEGARCADACRLTWRKAGRKVARLQPDCEGTDFNDLVLMRTRAG